MAAEARSKKQLGAASKSIQGDDFNKERQSLEKYLQSVLRHPLLGYDKHVTAFLEHRNPPIRSKIRKGFLKGVRASLESRKQSVKDVDEAFQRERDWSAKYGLQIKDVSDKFQSAISAQVKLANQIGLLATSLSSTVGGGEFDSIMMMKMMVLLTNLSKDPTRPTIDSMEDFLIAWMRRRGQWRGTWPMTRRPWART